MELIDTFGGPGRTFKFLYNGNFIFCVVLAMFFLIIIILVLTRDNVQSEMLVEDESAMPFLVPDMNSILTWGYDGQGVNLNISRLYRGHQEEYEDGYNKYHLNKYLSDRISMRRPLLDVRSQDCQMVSYNLNDLPCASVVVVFRNVPRTILLRMVYSVIDRSPKENIKEIILVDDNSNVIDLQFPKLEHYLSGLKKVRIIRLTANHGPTRARMHGARAATGEVLIFLQPHCECTRGWMEPLLEGISTDRFVITVPVIDRVDHRTFQYNQETLSELKVGSFTWELCSKKRPFLKHLENATFNVPNPVIADGIFAVDRNNLLKLGGLDEGLLDEDSVNIEFSFRSWMCGSQIVLVPCSHIGYLFPLAKVQTPDYLSIGTIRDRLKIAGAWMNDFKYFVYERVHARSQMNASQVNIIKALMRVSISAAPKLNKSCSEFDWYLENVEPTMHFTKKIERRGQILMMGVKNRILSLGVRDGNIILQEWVNSPSTFWYYQKSGVLSTENSTCLSYEPDNMQAEGRLGEDLSSLELSNILFHSDQNQYEPGAVHRPKEISVEKQNQDQLDSRDHQGALFQDQLEAHNLFPSHRNSNRSQLDYIGQMSIPKQYRPRQNVVHVGDIGNNVHLKNKPLKIDLRSYETQIKGQTKLSRNQHQKDLTKPLVISSTLDGRINTLDQSGNLTFTHEPEPFSISGLTMKPCENGNEVQQWILTKAQILQHVTSRLCMEAQKRTFDQYVLCMVQCDMNSWAQQWSFISLLLS